MPRCGDECMAGCLHGWSLNAQFFLKKKKKVVASLLSFCFAKEKFRKQSIKNNWHVFGGRGRYGAISLLVVGLIQDKSVITEAYRDLMLSGAGWGMHWVVYCIPQCTGDHFNCTFVLFCNIWLFLVFLLAVLPKTCFAVWIGLSSKVASGQNWFVDEGLYV